MLVENYLREINLTYDLLYLGIKKFNMVYYMFSLLSVYKGWRFMVSGTIRETLSLKIKVEV